MNEQQTNPTPPEEDDPPDWRQCYSKAGNDLTLIDWMLSLTPLERLQTLDDTLQALWRIRNGRSTPQTTANPDDAARP